MIRTVCGAAATLLVTAVLSASCADVECHDVLCKASSDGGTSPTGDGAANDGGNVTPPPGCDPTAEPKDSTRCVDDQYGVFVDATAGSDTNPGTMALPAKSITAALAKLAGKPRVYVCAGTYAETLALTSAVSLYGGFACGSWAYDGTKPSVAPALSHYALTITGVASALVVGDIAFRVIDATAPGDSSIAAFVQTSPRVSFVRVALDAGKGANGADGAAGVPGKLTKVSSGDLSLAGMPASGDIGGRIKICTCDSGDTSAGGSGGGAAASGGAGVPSYGGSAPNDGVGGLGPTTTCLPNGFGHNGASAPSAANGAKSSSLGLLTTSGWVPQAGAPGQRGKPGQGGGGGGGLDLTSGGGGGACGGCGGIGGQPGTGGGASVALLAFDAPVLLDSAVILAHDAGRGGNGGASGPGANGGTGANGGPNGCSSGAGGMGGAGGAGSAGAGGISAGILTKGATPRFESSTLTAGGPGAKGTGGAPGVNNGPDGAAGNIIEAP